LLSAVQRPFTVRVQRALPRVAGASSRLPLSQDEVAVARIHGAQHLERRLREHAEMPRRQAEKRQGARALPLALCPAHEKGAVIRLHNPPSTPKKMSAIPTRIIMMYCMECALQMPHSKRISCARLSAP
jgi:hypothetical protein